MVANVTQIAGSVPGVVALQTFLKDPVGQLESFRDSAGIQREIDYFNDRIQKVDDPDEFINDRRLLNFALSAFTLEGEINNLGRVKRILTEDPESERALQNRLADPRFKELADAFKFSEGVESLSDGAFIEELTQKFVINEFERTLGDQNAALREAAFFLRNIGDVQSELGILGDRVLRSVVTTTLNLPAQIAVQSITSQENLIKARLDIEDFQLNPGDTDTAGTLNDPETQAQADRAEVDRGNNIVSAGISQTSQLLDAIESVQADYERLVNIQSATGPYAAEIATQEAAVPELTREKGLLAAATSALGSADGSNARLEEIFGLLANSELTDDGFAKLQTDFDELVTDITNRVNNATFTYDDTDADTVGTTESLLDGSLSGQILSTTLDSAGSITTAVRGQDLSSYLTDLATVNAQVQSLTAGGANATLASAETTFDSARSDFDQVNITVTQDNSTFDARIAEVTQFAGTLETPELGAGALAVRDASNRTNLINVELTNLAEIAGRAVLLTASDDRTQIEAEFAASVSTINGLINDAGTGLDNLLDGSGDRTYQTISSSYLTARGQDFVTDISNVLSGLDVSDTANSQAVLDAVNDTFKPVIEAAFQEIGVDNQVFSFASGTLDPRGAVDADFRQIYDDFEGAITASAHDGISLLEENGFDVNIGVGVTGRTTVLENQGNFKADVLDTLLAAVGNLPSDSTDTSGALAALDTVRFNANRILTNLNSSLRTLSLEGALVDQTLTDLRSGGRESFTNIYEATDAAKEFVERFIITSDAAAFGAQFGLSQQASRAQTALTLLSSGPIVGGNLNIIS